MRKEFYATMLGAEAEVISEGFSVSWKALSSHPYEPAGVRYLLVNTKNDVWRTLSLIYEGVKGYYVSPGSDMIFDDDHEAAMLHFLSTMYQEGCDFFEGDALQVVRANQN